MAVRTFQPMLPCPLLVHPHLQFGVDDAEVKTKVSTLYIQEMAKRGCYAVGSFTLNAAQGEAELDHTENAARETFRIIAEGLADNRIDHLLECELLQESFRRLVR